jgi:hypothetical protein
MDRFTPIIRADGGQWSEIEMLGNQTLVKVEASDAVLDQIAASSTYIRIPVIEHRKAWGTVEPGLKGQITSLLASAGYDIEQMPTSKGMKDMLISMGAKRNRMFLDKVTKEFIIGPEVPANPHRKVFEE